MRLLFTSTDPGSAQQNNGLINYLNKNGIYDVAYISSLVGSKYYSSVYKNKLCLEFDLKSNKKKINVFIKKFNPDFIFLGLSSSVHSIDYIVSEIAIDKNIKTASIQDYYGWIGAFNKNVKPDYFFVIDKYAKKLTENMKICDSEKIIVSKSPKHFDYFNQMRIWNRYIKKIKIINKEFIFFLQPLHIKGIKSNFITLCESINKINPGYTLNVKPHPLDEKSEILNRISNQYPINIINYNKPIEILLFYFNNIINCFSTIAYDYYFISRYLVSFNNSRLYNLLIGDSLMSSMEKLNFDIKKTPQYKLGVNIDCKKSLNRNLKLIFNSKVSSEYLWKSPHTLESENSLSEIVNILKGV